MEHYWREINELYPELSKIITQEEVRKKINISAVDAGTVIGTIAQGCSDLLLIVKGYMRIEKIDTDGRITKLYELGPGEICHDSLSCYMNNEMLYLMGQAVTDMIVAKVPFQVVDKYLLNDLEFLKSVYSKLYEKFKTVVTSTESIIHESNSNRVIQYLINKESRNLYLTHQQIAYDLGTAREVISRQLKKLEISGAIKLERGRIRIIDMELLKQQKK